MNARAKKPRVTTKGTRSAVIAEADGTRFEVTLPPDIEAEWRLEPRFSATLVAWRGHSREVRWRVYERPGTAVLYVETARGRARSLGVRQRAKALVVAASELDAFMTTLPKTGGAVGPHPDGPTIGEVFQFARAERLHWRRVPKSKHAVHGSEVTKGMAGRRWRAMAFFEMILGTDRRIYTIDAKAVEGLQQVSEEGNCWHRTSSGKEYRGVRIPEPWTLESGRPFDVAECPATDAAETITRVSEIFRIVHASLALNDVRRIPRDPFADLDIRRKTRQLQGFHPARFNRVFEFLGEAEERLRRGEPPLCDKDKVTVAQPHLPQGIAKAYYGLVWGVGGRPGEPAKMDVSDIAFDKPDVARLIRQLQTESLNVPRGWADELPHGCWVRRTKSARTIIAPLSAAQAAYMKRYLESREAQLKLAGIMSTSLWIGGRTRAAGAPITKDALVRIWRDADILACRAERDLEVRRTVFEYSEDLGRPVYDDDSVNGVRGVTRVRHGMRNAKRTLLHELGWSGSKAADWLADWEIRGNAGVKIYQEVSPSEMLAIVSGESRASYLTRRAEQGKIEAASRLAAVPGLSADHT